MLRRFKETLALPPEYDSFFVRHNPANEQVIHEEFPGVLPRHVLHHELLACKMTQL